ncbi:MAG TPA: hypothetical protein PKL73_20275 [Polyangiaceae bacterium]|nr:hypothetical protein [Polyangiaceae bacterium]HNZ23015.1 hypothetical protein [Polyangiaceae bacterium]HOD21208.1 hypothetical protein [Polyangiaceae bacterium]HOE49028.1 hypothetical protein [Polyangiaceae bacterium]HOH01845.1 hypothetical protein [Polyangiaceae bacterium]
MPDDLHTQEVAYHNSIRLRLPFGSLKKKSRVTISSVSNAPRPDNATSDPTVYDFSVEGHTQFEEPVEIVLPFTPASTTKVGLGVDALTYDESAREWKPMPFAAHKEGNSVSIYTTHLSAFAMSARAGVALSPTMKIGSTPFPGSNEIMDAGTVEQIIRGDSAKAAQQGWAKSMEFFGISSNTGTFIEQAVLEIPGLKSLNGVATKLGVAFGFLQLAIDLASGNTQAASINAAKNLGYSSVALWGSQALQIGSVAVFIFDYTLTKVGETAWEGRTDLYQRAYALYYKEHPRKGSDWSKIVLGVIDSAKSADDVHKGIDSALQSYVTAFWENELVVAEYLERVKKNAQTGGGGLNEKMKAEISAAYRAEIMHLLQETVFPRIPIIIANRYRQNVSQLLGELRAGLDASTTIEVIVKSKDRERSVKNIDVQILVNQEPNRWHGVTDKDGRWSMPCTTLGYLSYGAPKKVKVTVPAENGKDAQSVEADLAYTPGKTTVVVELDGSGVFVGTIEDAQVVPGGDYPVKISGPVTITVASDGKATMDFSLTAKESVGKGTGVTDISSSGKLTGSLVGDDFKASGTVTSTYVSKFKLPRGVNLPPGTGSGTHSAAITATGKRVGNTIRGTLQGAQGKAVRFQATQSNQSP